MPAAMKHQSSTMTDFETHEPVRTRTWLPSSEMPVVTQSSAISTSFSTRVPEARCTR